MNVDVDELRKLVAEILRIDLSEVKENLSMDDSEKWDSLAHMELVTAIELRYQFELTMDEIVCLKDIPAILRLIESK